MPLRIDDDEPLLLSDEVLFRGRWPWLSKGMSERVRGSRPNRCQVQPSRGREMNTGAALHTATIFASALSGKSRQRP